MITHSVRLAADVTGCLGEGIAIGAPNIVLDLNGHTVSGGLVLEPGEEDNLTPGIRSGYSNVEIRNGTVTNFGYGVLLGPGAIHNEVHNMNLVRNALAGITLFDADNGRIGSTVRNNVIDSNGETGVQLMSGTEGAKILNNTFLSNGMSIHLFSSSDNEIVGNEISGIILDPALDSDAGIVLEQGSKRNTLVDNNVHDTGDAGIVIHQGSHGNVVRGGQLVRNGDAGVIVQDSDRIEIDGVLSHQQSDGGVVLSNSSNSIVKNSQLGYNPSGVDASGTNNLIVEGNDVSRSLQSGIELGDGLNMVVRNNIASHNGGSGISVEGAAFDALGGAVGWATIEGNIAHQNAESGLSIATGRHIVKDNVASNNSGYGIEAGEETTPGEPLDPNRNTDGGGNKASGNHADGVLPGLPDAIQCVGVTCSPDPSVPTMAPEDLTPPETFLDGTPPASGGNDRADFIFRGEDAGWPATGDAPTALRFECRLDAPPDPPVPPEEPELEPPDPTDPPELPEPPEGELWVECFSTPASPHTYLSLEPGTHKFEVRALDQVGNFDLTPEVYEWTITAGVEEDGVNECGPGSPPPRAAASTSAWRRRRGSRTRRVSSSPKRPARTTRRRTAPRRSSSSAVTIGPRATTSSTSASTTTRSSTTISRRPTSTPASHGSRATHRSSTRPLRSSTAATSSGCGRSTWAATPTRRPRGTRGGSIRRRRTRRLRTPRSCPGRTR